MFQQIVYALVTFILVAYAADFLFSLRDDPREPPRLHSKFPLLGHAFGFLTRNRAYLTDASKRTDAEIYTIGVFNFKLYICVSNRLISAVQKESKTLSFKPFVQLAQHTLGDATPETYDLFGGEMLSELTRVTRARLAPGPHLDEPNMRMGERILLDMDDLLSPDTRCSEKRIKLLDWGRHAIVQASSCAVYGEKHPFLDPEVEAALWIWQGYIPLHFAGLDIFKSGYKQRQKVFDSLVTYYKGFESYPDASEVAKVRWRVLKEAGLSDIEAAKQEVSLCIGITGNTAPTFYWVVWELFSRPTVLEEVRLELQEQAVRDDHGDDGGFVLDVASLKSKCPLLLSVIEETQRYHHIHATVRKIMKDTILDSRYLLKKGNYLQIPGNTVHFQPHLWGPDVQDFDPYRFLAPAGNKKKHEYAPHAPGTANAFLAWGAPPNLCPARQFAATEVMIMVALLAVRADIRPRQGKWEQNPEWNHSELHSVLNPKIDVTVCVRKRPEWDGRWRLEMGEKKTRVSLTSG